MKYPCLCVETCPSSIERNLDFAAWQASEIIQRFHLSRASVCGREDSKSRSWLAHSAHGGGRLENVEQLSNPRHCDEAHQDVHLVAAGDLTAKFCQKGWGTFARSKQPRDSESSRWSFGCSSDAMNGSEYLRWLDQRVHTSCGRLPKVNQQCVHEIELSFCLLCPLPAEFI